MNTCVYVWTDRQTDIYGQTTLFFSPQSNVPENSHHYHQYITASRNSPPCPSMTYEPILTVYMYTCTSVDQLHKSAHCNNTWLQLTIAQCQSKPQMSTPPHSNQRPLGPLNVTQALTPVSLHVDNLLETKLLSLSLSLSRSLAAGQQALAVKLSHSLTEPKLVQDFKIKLSSPHPLSLSLSLSLSV